MQLLLEGEVDNRDEIILELREENERLSAENRRLQTEVSTARAQNGRAIAMLRHQLEPLYKALRAVFGEIEASGIGEVHETPTGVNPHVAAVWDSWKQKLPGNRADIIQALIEHGEASVAQLKVMTHTPRAQTIYDNIFQLNKLGLISKSGKGSYKLKEL